jgi:hypothetical protein
MPTTVRMAQASNVGCCILFVCPQNNCARSLTPLLLSHSQITALPRWQTLGRQPPFLSHFAGCLLGRCSNVFANGDNRPQEASQDNHRCNFTSANDALVLAVPEESIPSRSCKGSRGQEVIVVLSVCYKLVACKHRHLKQLFEGARSCRQTNLVWSTTETLEALEECILPPPALQMHKLQQHISPQAPLTHLQARKQRTMIEHGECKR